MSEAIDRQPVADPEARVVAEHRRIRDAAGRLHGAHELSELLRHLDSLRSVLVPHFMGEEAADGLYDAIRSMAPRQIARLDQLEREHGQFLADLDLVVLHARQCLSGPVADVLDEARDLARRLLAHEASEDDVLMDTMYTDLGQGD